MFREAYKKACLVAPKIEVKNNTLEPHKIDRLYLRKPYGLGSTKGCGSKKEPYTHMHAGPTSAYYAIVDLWFQFRCKINGKNGVYILVNTWVFKLTPNGVIYGTKEIRFV
jgi:hypothetical protein